MVYSFQSNEVIKIEGVNYKIAEHPSAPGMPFGVSGRRATVYKLTGDGEDKALKVFQPIFREPRMVGVTEKLKKYADFPGLRVAKRIVLTASKHADLLKEEKNLTYAILMPWIEGNVWTYIIYGKIETSPQNSLILAKSFTSILLKMEENGLAHCDLSSANLIITAKNEIELIDIEEMFGPDFMKPSKLPAGSPGYAHKLVIDGLWSEEADRFAGAILIAEFLGWSSEKVRKSAWDDSFFNPEEMQTDCERFQILFNEIRNLWGSEISELFHRAWFSESLRECPTFSEWFIALPEKWSDYHATAFIQEYGNSEEKTIPTNELHWACPNCSAIVSVNLEICPKCETGIKPDSDFPNQPIEEKSSICPTCGKYLNKETSICPYCEGVTPSKIKWSKKNILVVLGIISIIVLLMVVFGKGIINPSSTKITIIPSIDSPNQPVDTLTPSASKTPTALQTKSPTPVITSTPTINIPLGSIQISDIDNMEMVYIPEGNSIMGINNTENDESPQHKVYLDAFWIDKHEVTNGQYQFCVNSGNCTKPENTTFFSHKDYTNHPVIFVNWYDAKNYCNWAGRDLPTEAQWEKAARGPDGYIYPWGNEKPKGFQANFCDKTCGEDWKSIYINDGYKKTAPVGNYQEGSSPYGVLDLAGNVWEWVGDWYSENYYSSQSTWTNPIGPTTGDYKVIRGGGWGNLEGKISSTNRGRDGLEDIGENLGFRCVLNIQK